MSDPKDELKIENKIVLVTDICSSSEIMEDLLRTNNIVIWRNLLINFKKDLVDASNKLDFELYKFTGDGWLLLFKSDYDGSKILNFIFELSDKFEKEFNTSIYPYLESPPDIFGLTFGMDSGPLVSIEMMERQEYVGRAINVSCRLQGIIEETDILTGYRVIISNHLFHLMGEGLHGYHPELIRRRLKNIIRGNDFQCYRLSISEIPFKIIKASYGTENNSIDVTKELVSLIKRGCIDTFAINEFLGGDPDRHVEKKLCVEYLHNGEIKTKNVKEGSRFQLP
jgi:class 3 adenylate cyclase